MVELSSNCSKNFVSSLSRSRPSLMPAGGGSPRDKGRRGTSAAKLRVTICLTEASESLMHLRRGTTSNGAYGTSSTPNPCTRRLISIPAPCLAGTHPPSPNMGTAFSTMDAITLSVMAFAIVVMHLEAANLTATWG
uniref:Uncharacterized protein n=1 Tax=Opuntia streptacantha TaxID=393608 RepID=A0A7C8Z8W2_OPUST